MNYICRSANFRKLVSYWFIHHFLILRCSSALAAPLGQLEQYRTRPRLSRRTTRETGSVPEQFSACSTSRVSITRRTPRLVHDPHRTWIMGALFKYQANVYGRIP